MSFCLRRISMKSLLRIAARVAVREQHDVVISEMTIGGPGDFEMHSKESHATNEGRFSFPFSVKGTIDGTPFEMNGSTKMTAEYSIEADEDGKYAWTDTTSDGIGSAHQFKLTIGGQEFAIDSDEADNIFSAPAFAAAEKKLEKKIKDEFESSDAKSD
jgi:hypothetical protein